MTRPKAVLYVRVSTLVQAEKGYSLRQQEEALRDHCEAQDHEIVEVVRDEGWSGATLERPGLDRVRDLVAAGGVSVVLAQDRDRFAREPAYLYLLRKEFEEHGTKIRALNDRGDESPEGELTDGILDQLAKFERAKTAERTRRGKLRKAREGKVVATHQPLYGFMFNASRDGYEVDEATMPVVRRIFRAVGAEGSSLHAVKVALERDGVPTAKGHGRWNLTTIRRVIGNDAYRPHTYEEVAALVSPEVASRLDPARRYGIWWFNRNRVTRAARAGKKRRKFTPKPEEELVAVPVPDAGVPRELADAARRAVKDNRRPSSAGRRYWELSGGVAFCPCGRRLTTHSTLGGRSGKRYFYYGCPLRERDGKDACPHAKLHRAEALEEAVAEHVSSELLTDPGKLSDQMDEAIDREAGALRDPGAAAKAWAERIGGCERRRAAYQDQQAAGLMTLAELSERLRGLDAERAAAEGELSRLRDAQGRVAEMRARKRAVLSMYGTGLMLGLDWMPPPLRRFVYELLGLRVVAHPDRTLRVEGAFDANVVRYAKEVEDYAAALREADRRLAEAPPEDAAEGTDRLERELGRLRRSFWAEEPTSRSLR